MRVKYGGDPEHTRGILYLRGAEYIDWLTFDHLTISSFVHNFIFLVFQNNINHDYLTNEKCPLPLSSLSVSCTCAVHIQRDAFFWNSVPHVYAPIELQLHHMVGAEIIQYHLGFDHFDCHSQKSSPCVADLLFKKNRTAGENIQNTRRRGSWANQCVYSQCICVFWKTGNLKEQVRIGIK